MASVSTTVTADWTVVKDANGYPTVVSGDDVKVYVNDDTPFFSGEAWSDIDLMSAIPSGATITGMTFSMTAQLDATRQAPTLACAPEIDIIDKAQYLAGTWVGVGYGGFGAGGVGDLPDDNDPHFITYDNATYAAVSGGGGIVDVDAFAVALSNASTPVIMRVQGPQNATTGSALTYVAPIMFTFTYTTPAATPSLSTIAPPQRLYPRPDGLGGSTARRLYPLPATVQASNRRGPSAIL
jgi:hypothetical protein